LKKIAQGGFQKVPGVTGKRVTERFSKKKVVGLGKGLTGKSSGGRGEHKENSRRRGVKVGRTFHIAERKFALREGDAPGKVPLLQGGAAKKRV